VAKLGWARQKELATSTLALTLSKFNLAPPSTQSERRYFMCS